MRLIPFSLGALLVLQLGIFARANVKLPAIIGDNMVLQRSGKVPVWGWASPGEHVQVQFDQQVAKTVAGDDGSWQVILDLSKEPQGPFEMVVAGNNTLKLKNILVGQVWVCSGQSNMEMGIKGVFNADEEVAAANYPGIRLFNVTKQIAHQAEKDVKGRWTVCTPANVVLGRWTGFSAVAYFFGRELNLQLGGTPVGLIDCSWGGTWVAAWTSSDSLAAKPILAPLLGWYGRDMKNYPTLIEKFQVEMTAWQKRANDAKMAGKDPPPRPARPLNPTTQPYPGQLYDGMVAPLTPLAIAGTIWYQGESDANRPDRYRISFPNLISNWREKWGRGDFPFIFVQLANYTPPKTEPGESDWAELREAQTFALGLPNTAMAVTIDVGEAKTIHPRDKQDVGKRLALAALAMVYGKHVEFWGPMYSAMTVEGSSIRLTFMHADGLFAKNGKPANFAIAGRNHKFVWADAAIEGNAIVVHSDKVPAPVAVRYAWAENPPQPCNIYNGAGLPAAPFRTDDWPGVPAGENIP
jgi:sialate O-acetylesterase